MPSYSTIHTVDAAYRLTHIITFKLRLGSMMLTLPWLGSFHLQFNLIFRAVEWSLSLKSTLTLSTLLRTDGLLLKNRHSHKQWPLLPSDPFYLRSLCLLKTVLLCLAWQDKCTLIDLYWLELYLSDSNGPPPQDIISADSHPIPPLAPLHPALYVLLVFWRTLPPPVLSPLNL